MRASTLKIIVSMAIWFMAVGCVTQQQVSIEVLKPAEVSLPANIKSVVLVNTAFVNQAASFAHPVQGTLFEFDTLVSQSTHHKLATLLSQSPRFDTAFMADAVVFRPSNQLHKPLSVSAIQKFNKAGADAVLSLEAFSLVDTVYRYQYQLSSGHLIYSTFGLIATGVWRMYDAQTGNQVFSTMLTDTLFNDQFESSQHYLNYLGNQQNRITLANETANVMAYKLADKLAPFWQTESRYILVTSTDSIVQGARLAYQAKWLEAAQYWKPLTQNSSAKTAAIAMHNMALVCEVAGKFNLSIQYLEQAITLKANPISVHYKLVLEQRLTDAKLLDQQFGK
jgi:hypothetical protein